MPQITTVIPTYRRPALLRRSIQSVLNQSYRDFEVHVYDNASGDETPEVVRAIASRDPRVRYYRHDRNIGLVENFAFGMSRVRTPYFNLLSDDDFVFPRFFEIAMRELTGHDGAMAFVGGLIEADPSGRTVRLPFVNWKPGLLNPPDALLAMSLGGLGTWTSTLFRTSLLSTTGGLDPRFGLAVDSEFQMRVLARHPVIFCNVPCGVFFYNYSSASRNERIPETAAALSRILCQLNGVNSASCAEISREFNARFREMIFGKARAAACEGNLADASVAAAMLRRDFHSPREARILDLMASRSIGGELSRTSFRAARNLLRLWRRRNQSVSYREVNFIVANALAQLGSPTQS